ncbi:TetR family transcriptional regulator [Streptomyces sp. NPDC059009]|uniref:TetR family transcriptional regulator n=1 Tax=Streptomyces sp. NPDC059009 TaxID=3346694 RepID=UPI00368AED33
MVKQQRAARTREALVQAAAVAFDRVGYEAASLSQVSKAAEISMGALTFHFPMKEQLAHAVQVRGATATEAVTRAIAEDSRRPLDRMLALTLEIAQLLDEDVAVRAAARLTRECPHLETPWPATWLPVVEKLIAEAEGDLRPGVAPRTVLALTSYLMVGTEAYVRRGAAVPGACAADAQESARDQLSRIWRVVFPCISVTE